MKMSEGFVKQWFRMMREYIRVADPVLRSLYEQGEWNVNEETKQARIALGNTISEGVEMAKAFDSILNEGAIGKADGGANHEPEDAGAADGAGGKEDA